MVEPDKIFHEYCENTTIYGLKYLGNPKRSRIEKLWWIISVIGSLIVCGYFMYDSYTQWKTEAFIISFADTYTPIENISFPSITICPEIKSKKKEFDFSKTLTIFELNPDNITQEEFGTNFLSNCINSFSEVLTEEGLCYTLNMSNSSEIFREEEIQKEYKYIGVDSKNKPKHHNAGAGAKSGLEIYLSYNLEDYDPKVSNFVKGFKILLHTSGSLPQISQQYYRVPINQEIVLSLSPNQISTAPSLHSYHYDERKCFMDQEKYLKFFKSYDQKNCELECLANYTVNICGCAKFSMPRSPETRICGSQEIQCYKNAEEKHINSRLENDSCYCLPSCSAITYDAQISQGSFDFSNYSPDESMVYLRVFFKESQFLSLKRTEIYGLDNLIASCGGLLGVFVGLSSFSVIEAIYYAYVRYILYNRKKKNEILPETISLKD